MTTRASTAKLAPLALAISLLIVLWAASVPNASAQGTEFTVLAGWEDLNAGIEVQAFLPENIIVAEGDTITVHEGAEADLTRVVEANPAGHRQFLPDVGPMWARCGLAVLVGEGATQRDRVLGAAVGGRNSPDRREIPGQP